MNALSRRELSREAFAQRVVPIGVSIGQGAKVSPAVAQFADSLDYTLLKQAVMASDAARCYFSIWPAYAPTRARDPEEI